MIDILKFHAFSLVVSDAPWNIIKAPDLQSKLRVILNDPNRDFRWENHGKKHVSLDARIISIHCNLISTQSQHKRTRQSETQVRGSAPSDPFV